MEEWMGLTKILSFTAYIYEINRRGVTPRGLGIHVHVPTRVMGKFAIFCTGYESCFVNLALVMSLLYRDLPISVNFGNL